jgi:16S rRNA C1402 (ribose-2'-O) methylase RsmI
MTKLHEEIVRGSASELAEHYASARPKGEITVVVAPANNAGEQAASDSGATNPRT